MSGEPAAPPPGSARGLWILLALALLVGGLVALAVSPVFDRWFRVREDPVDGPRAR
jgi:hypothetical protein